uniref:Uncharacterized protein n=1 Tax=Oryza nivara TaxID=4536 RepID=A0A0E0J5F5_ORYNI
MQTPWGKGDLDEKRPGLGFVVGYQSEPLVLVAGNGEEFAAAAAAAAGSLSYPGPCHRSHLFRCHHLHQLLMRPPSPSSLRPVSSRRQDPGPPRRGALAGVSNPKMLGCFQSLMKDFKDHLAVLMVQVAMSSHSKNTALSIKASHGMFQMLVQDGYHLKFPNRIREAPKKACT